MDADSLRRAFTQFFVERSHHAVPSAPLVPHHPTAPMFTNSGMNQFVPYFLGEEAPPWPRATSVQKCVRLSGKHNDIEELGRTRRHLTFFEMLGNWSFGDYFKEGAIAYAWEFVTEVAGFDGDRIWVTVHDSDDDAEAIWRDTVGLPAERIQRLGDKDNFWQMGETGPCGPDSELHYDCGPEWGDAGGPAHGANDRYIEFWNLVFMQYSRHGDGSLTDLPTRNIDTGAGLERWLMLLQGVPTVFDTDLVRPLIARVESISGRRYGTDDRQDTWLRIVADHARTMAFLVADGVTPSNEDRGYVLRSVVRRAVRRGWQLGIERPFLTEVLDDVVAVMAGAYPELARDADAVGTTVAREEERFWQTLRTGTALLDEELAGGAVSGPVAFRLHDTFGFPIELTEEIAAERGVTVDRRGFDAAMTEQRDRARASARKEVVSAGGLDAYRQLVDEHGRTVFTGYGAVDGVATVLAVLPTADERVEVFLDRTPFYAEGGGQVGDTGTLTSDTGRAEVLDTTAPLPGLHRHLVRMVEGEFRVGQPVQAVVGGGRRQAIRRNHTGTHLLHAALREVLGPHVKQQGSFVGPEYLRFDFSHFGPVGAGDLATIEEMVNAQVLANEAVRVFETSKAEAERLGALAFFGDKYGDTVRVVEAGAHSRELCGGTHVDALGTIGPVTVVSESSIGANIRRVTGLTGTATLERYQEDGRLLGRAASLLRADPKDVPGAVERLLERQRALEAELKAVRTQAASGDARSLAAAAVAGAVVARRDGLPPDQLRDLALAVRNEPGVWAVVLVGTPDGTRVTLVAAVEPGGDLAAPALLAEPARQVGGGGGGRGDVAQAGGKDVAGIDAALAAARAGLGIA
ncbi:MAG TPA: alanine--tRNA ligase [Acidimicrobiales bacterium]|nr:alanine--tRNA ligase [Acidimicrobiales bacterium]